jgi:hypothetical protein
VSVYGQNVFSRKEVSVWRNKFKDGRTALNDEPGQHRGRQKTSLTDEDFVIMEGFFFVWGGVKPSSQYY